jgi:hypothetical protein
MTQFDTGQQPSGMVSKKNVFFTRHWERLRNKVWEMTWNMRKPLLMERQLQTFDNLQSFLKMREGPMLVHKWTCADEISAHWYAIGSVCEDDMGNSQCDEFLVVRDCHVTNRDMATLYNLKYLDVLFDKCAHGEESPSDEMKYERSKGMKGYEMHYSKEEREMKEEVWIYIWEVLAMRQQERLLEATMDKFVKHYRTILYETLVEFVHAVIGYLSMKHSMDMHCMDRNHQTTNFDLEKYVMEKTECYQLYQSAKTKIAVVRRQHAQAMEDSFKYWRMHG